MDIKTKLVCTMGPSSDSEETIKRLYDEQMSMARINMSHASIEYAKKIVKKIKGVGVPIILDLQGAEVRTEGLGKPVAVLEENQKVKIHKKSVEGDEKNISLSNPKILDNSEIGGIISIDDGNILLKVCGKEKDYVETIVLKSGVLGINKVVKVESQNFELPIITEKDEDIINYAIKEGVEYLALSFVNSSKDVIKLKEITKDKIKIISKIENKAALKDLDNIIDVSDGILVDRFDLGTAISVDKVPLIQKIVVKKCVEKKRDVFVASHLLNSMTKNLKPTRAEVNDVINTILDGASGLVLAEETANGRYPIETLRTLGRLCRNAELVIEGKEEEKTVSEGGVIDRIDALNYIEIAPVSSLVDPHGGKLVNRIISGREKELELSNNYLESLFKLKVDQETLMDMEQIGIGTFSPIEGFMCSDDFHSVLDNMKLKNGVVWTIPIILAVSSEKASKLKIGQDIGLTNNKGILYSILHLEEKYSLNKKETAKKMYNTTDTKHPGVSSLFKLGEVLLGGKIDIVRRKESEFKEYELTPLQTRKIFEEKSWSKVVGFHTRNVTHKCHEFIQLKALEEENCDGLFVHPIIGKKKKGDFQTQAIIDSYRIMQDKFYPRNKVVFSAFSTFSRYAGPREAIFTALCRKNFGCSHFIVGRDHTGVGDYYDPLASHKIFGNFSPAELGVKPIFFDRVFYCKKCNGYTTEENCNHKKEIFDISGTKIREIFEDGKKPPEWFMRKEISEMVLEHLKNGVAFVK